MKTNLIMGFDFGTKKIGVAIGQMVTATATPLSIIRVEKGVPNWCMLEKLISQWKPERLVVGLPLNMDDSHSNMSRRALKFSSELENRFGIAVSNVDERLSTFEARQLYKNGRTESSQEELDDKVAALILESWLRDRI
ncbi:MAG: Holliday junction resolvase RuvX [Gammaproteobacteria bacterium TMED1]|jgi:putative Holliday junction resolvase|nr:MAG: Holliday junction resolvase RuvX [Gammaproteobacteria bacterium TMED1]|tara:strand:- start:1321 stop:1734 length:414 start_codon:yes stop_codon:yes gene_type:complete